VELSFAAQQGIGLAWLQQDLTSLAQGMAAADRNGVPNSSKLHVMASTNFTVLLSTN